MDKFLPILEKSRLFQGIDREGIRGMLDCIGASATHYGRGEALLETGNVASAIGLVLSGEVHLVREDFWGNNESWT